MIDERTRLIINNLEERNDREFMCFIVSSSIMAGGLVFTLVYTLLR